MPCSFREPHAERVALAPTEVSSQRNRCFREARQGSPRGECHAGGSMCARRDVTAGDSRAVPDGHRVRFAFPAEPHGRACTECASAVNRLFLILQFVSKGLMSTWGVGLKSLLRGPYLGDRAGE